MANCINNKPKKVSNEEAISIIETRKPLGLFYCIETNKSGKEIYVGIDNLTGDAWTEDYDTLRECIVWLEN